MTTRTIVCELDLVLEDGSIAESTKTNGEPAKLTIGNGSLSPACESELANLSQGDKHKFTLPPEHAFGGSNPSLFHKIEKGNFPTDIPLEVGLIVGFTSPEGQEFPGIIRAIEGDLVTVDLNHPLAGQNVTFDLEVLEVH